MKLKKCEDCEMIDFCTTIIDEGVVEEFTNWYETKNIIIKNGEIKTVTIEHDKRSIDYFELKMKKYEKPECTNPLNM